MTRPTLGVMVLYMNQKRQIEELRYFRRLLVAGEQLGMNVFMFTPEDVDHQKKQVNALFYNKVHSRWVRKWTPMPSLIFDRCRFQRTKRFQQLRQFRSRYPNLTYLNRPLANKWVIYQWLSGHGKVRPHLPETEQYQNSRQLLAFLKRHSTVFLKPINGTGGRGILKVQQLGPSTFRLEGRNHKRKIIMPQKVTAKSLAARLNKWQAGLPYIMQQGIPLNLDSGRVHDYRLLFQKNRQGKWESTGCAGRIGASRSITSNLHGGGKAVQADALLRKWFDAKTAEHVKASMVRLGTSVIDALEQKYKQMCELALDIAVDRSGHPWLLEINPKPSREIFNRIGEKETYRTAIIRPLQYALWLHEQGRG